MAWALTSQLFNGEPSPLSKPLSWKPLCSLRPAICSDTKAGVRTNRFLPYEHAKCCTAMSVKRDEALPDDTFKWISLFM
eukprot:1146268-Pelagomonas_calceolata.AAC.3